MTLKDFLWIIRRRLLWFVSCLIMILLFYAFLLFREKTSYVVSATVLIDVPRELTPFTQGSLRVYTPPTTLKNWQLLLTSKHVKTMTIEALKKNGRADLAEIVYTITASPVSPDTTLTQLTATAEHSESAAIVLNTLVETAAMHSREEATKHLQEARSALTIQIQQNRDDVLPRMEKEINDLKQKARAWDIPKKVEAILTLLQRYDEEIETLERKKKQNMHLIDKMHKDRAAAQHLNRELYPKAVSPTSQISYEILSKTSPYIDQLQQKLLSLRFSYNSQARKWKPSHPEMQGMLQEIRDTEAALIQAKVDALGAHMDREEANLFVQNELHDLEITSLQQTSGKVQGEYTEILKLEQKYRPLERDYNELVSRMSAMTHTLDNLATAISGSGGYVVPRERASKTEALPAEKKTTKMAPFVLLIGLILAVGSCFIAEFLDTSIRTDVDIKRHLNYPVIGIVPYVKQGEVILTRAKEMSVLTEVFDTIATMIHTVCAERKIRSLTITSTNPEEGKTCMSINIAIALARQGKRVILVDGDMRKPAVHSFLGHENMMGFTDLLLAARTVNDAASLPSPLELATGTEIPNLKVILSGKLIDQPYALLDPQKLKIVIAKLEQEADYVVVDTPPLLLTGDALKVASTTGLALFVIESGKTDQKRAGWAKHLLTNVGVPVLGAVLNKAGASGDQYYYYYYYRYRDKYYKSPRT